MTFLKSMLVPALEGDTDAQRMLADYLKENGTPDHVAEECYFGAIHLRRPRSDMYDFHGCYDGRGGGFGSEDGGGSRCSGDRAIRGSGAGIGSEAGHGAGGGSSRGIGGLEALEALDALNWGIGDQFGN